MPPATRVSLIGTLILAVAGIVAVSSNPALAGQVSCGDTIKIDTTLHANLTNCPNNGLVIGANGITLDLNGHTIDGNNQPVDPCSEDFCDLGIANDSHNEVTIKGGAVRQFDGGVFLFEARHNRILDVTASRNNFDGIILSRCMHSKVKRSTGRRNGVTNDSNGIVLFESEHNLLKRNRMRRNGDFGLWLVESDNNRVVANSFSRNQATGMTIENSNQNMVNHNILVRDPAGIILLGDENVIRNNHVKRALGRNGAGKGISFEDGNGNLIARNKVKHTLSDGIEIGFKKVADNIVRRNHVRDSGGDGIRAIDKAKGTIIRRNHVFGAGDDGIDSDSSTSKISRNETRRNSDLGIEAVQGDRGRRNRSSGNGDRRQCTHVSCR